MEKKRVVVTGLGALTPIGNTISEYWDNLVKGALGEIRHQLERERERSWFTPSR